MKAFRHWLNLNLDTQILTDIASHNILNIVTASLGICDLTLECSKVVVSLFDKIKDGNNVPALKEKLMKILMLCLEVSCKALQ